MQSKFVEKCIETVIDNIDKNPFTVYKEKDLQSILFKELSKKDEIFLQFRNIR